MKFNIFLMVIDSLQARKFYGEKTSLTPNIDSLMKKGTYFENFISACDSSLLSLTSLFTGKHAFKTGIRSARYTMLIENGAVKKVVEEETAGKCEITSAENFLKKI